MALNYETLKWLFDSPYFVPELDNWHLKEGAPEDVKKEFEEYMKDQEN